MVRRGGKNAKTKALALQNKEFYRLSLELRDIIRQIREPQTQALDLLTRETEYILQAECKARIFRDQIRALKQEDPQKHLHQIKFIGEALLKVVEDRTETEFERKEVQAIRTLHESEFFLIENPNKSKKEEINRMKEILLQSNIEKTQILIKQAKEQNKPPAEIKRDIRRIKHLKLLNF